MEEPFKFDERDNPTKNKQATPPQIGARFKLNSTKWF